MTNIEKFPLMVVVAANKNLQIYGVSNIKNLLLLSVRHLECEEGLDARDLSICLINPLYRKGLSPISVVGIS